MSNHKYNQNLLIGAAVAAGIIGTLTSYLGFKKKGRKWSEQAKGIASHVLETGEALNKKLVLGSVAGGLVGAAAALLLAPKSGSDLIKDLAGPFSHKVGEVRSEAAKSASHRSTALKKKASSSPKKSHAHKATSKKVEKKGLKASHTKKSTPPRHKVAAVHKAPLAHEKAIHEVKQA